MVDQMFDAMRQKSADQILELACRIAGELARKTGRTIHVAGWCGSDGKMNWEYVVEFDGQGCNLDIGDADLLTFPHDGRVRAEIEDRVRRQMQAGLELVRPSA